MDFVPKDHLSVSRCLFHGCFLCYDANVVNPISRIKMGVLFRQTAEMTEKPRTAGYQVLEKWEHEFQKDKKSDPQLKPFLESHELQDRLNPRDAFFGGRSNAIQLFYEGNAKYSFIDFTS
ncbi:hypothetical protein JTE90_023073 [Oedothorax gibbosus]|uniref:Uncharacterized protein n=1 Tax=Oedothorax gibbosus TaxID=931172 RepID=A0AAV6UYP3_9ARAC|nr:hypothetical protein JTE90_023073 [Oedothorax gibbosus]